MLFDRVQETSTTTGTGTISLAGVVAGYRSFVSAVGTGNQCYYVIVDNSTGDFEVGIGTVTDATPDTLSRTTVITSSNSNALVDFASGTRNVFVALPSAYYGTDNIVTKTTTYTATLLDRTILCDATGGAFTVTLPAAAASKNLKLTIKKIDSSLNAITIDGNGSETIDGVTTQKLYSQYDAITIHCNGSAWYIL